MYEHCRCHWHPILLLPQTSCAVIVIVKFESCLISNENIMNCYVALKKLMKKLLHEREFGMNASEWHKTR